LYLSFFWGSGKDEKMKIKAFKQLPEESRMIRTRVFMEEQKFENEFDEIDSISTHIVIFESAEPVATCRLYFSGERQCYVIGRIAVLKDFRGRNLGAELLKAAEKEIISLNGNTAELLAQVRVSAFYEKKGYRSLGEVLSDEGCPHVWMRKEL
ncbi:MAG: GNAT family N-acetyltransferase, partial [Acetatifactor sp.]